MACFTSPCSFPTKACSASSPPLRNSAMVAPETFVFSPSSQVAGSASSAVFACHQRSATTATALLPTFTTCLTPGMSCTLGASKLMSLPPNTGQSLIAAHSMPGSLCASRGKSEMAEDKVNALGSIAGPAKPAEAGLAIVVPLFNEANSLAGLHAELLEVARRLASARGLETEVIYVDDGSRDATLATARRLAP